MTASGTSGSKDELNILADRDDILGALGAFVTKGVSLAPRTGNPELRIVETRCGLLNSIGLQNNGAETFAAKELPLVATYGRPIIVNISAGSVAEFGELAALLAARDADGVIAGFEINVSCPNIKEGGAAFGGNPKLVAEIATVVREAVGSERLVITKLSPNVADITEPARAAVDGGSDALSMINTLRGIAIDVETRRPLLGNVVGGLSGPAIRPVGVFMVHECFRRIEACRDGRVPIIGIGGIATARDALEYILAGATAVGVGTAWFVKPTVFLELRDGLQDYVQRHGIPVRDLVGAVHA